ncbi:MAG: DEAD/DEAH box helicase [Vicinamibacterales bacterium]
MNPTSRPATDSLVRIRNQRWRVGRVTSSGSCVIASVVGADTHNRGHRTTFLLPFDLCGQITPTTSPRRVTARGWRRLARRALGAAEPSPHSLRAAAAARFEPLAFQLEPALAWIRGDTTRLLIADAVGLGKTVQAGLLVAEALQRRPGGRVLVIVPAGLTAQWRDELRERFDVTLDLFDAAGLWRATSELPIGVNPWATTCAAVTSIDFVKRPEVLRALEPLVWDLIVFDEAHTLTGRSDRHLAAAGLAARARGVVLLTATPHDGDADAFGRLCELGNINNAFPLTVFKRTHRSLGEDWTRRSVWFRLSTGGTEKALHEALLTYARRVWSEEASAGARLAMFVLLKRGASSSAALVRSLERRRVLLGESTLAPDAQLVLPLGQDDNEPCAELSAPGLSSRDTELSTIDALIALGRSVAGEQRKIHLLSRLLRRTAEPAIVFTQYKDTLDELADSFATAGTTCIHGSLSLRERTAAVRAFTHGDVRLLLATDAASEGLNLHTRCRLVVSFDLPWTPTRLEQRVGRVDRIGQTRRVHAWQMVASGTYEEEVARRVALRARVAHDALDVLETDDEREITEEVVTNTSPAAGVERRPPAGMRLPPADLVCRAADESSRIRLARRLLRTAADAVPDRPFTAKLRTRRTRGTVFAFRATFADAGGEPLWDTVIGLYGAWHADRLWIDHVLTAREAARLVEAAVNERFRDELRDWHQAAATTLRRDRAIAGVLRRESARLSAALVQRELFSRRAERTLAPQLQSLDQSINMLQRASRETARIRGVRVESVLPLFAVSFTQR